MLLRLFFLDGIPQYASRHQYHRCLLYTSLHLVTENHGVAFGEGRVSLRQVLELGGAFYLLDAIYLSLIHIFDKLADTSPLAYAVIFVTRCSHILNPMQSYS